MLNLIYFSYLGKSVKWIAAIQMKFLNKLKSSNIVSRGTSGSCPTIKHSTREPIFILKIVFEKISLRLLIWGLK